MKAAEIKVDYIDHMGDDLTVVNSARVSFDKRKEIFDEQDERLIKYLATHNHWSPFAHTSVQFKVSAPIFVARQLVKHQVGGVWNEVSRRYVSDEPTFYIPSVWRGKPAHSKQGSSDEIIENVGIVDIMNEAIKKYNELLEQGVAPEMARMILPQNMMTDWYWTGSLVFWERVCKQRLDAHAQEETRTVAKQISDSCSMLFPVSWKYLLQNKNNNKE